MTRVLIVNQYYPPDRSATAAIFRDIAQTFAARAAAVRVLCGRPSYSSARRIPWRFLSRETADGVPVERVGSTSMDRRKLIDRIINYSSFGVLAAARSLLIRRPDVVVCGSDPPFSVWVSLIAARGRPVVYALQDLHPEFAVVSGMMRPGLVERALERVHRAGLKRCHTIVCLGETMRDRVIAKGIPPERVKVVPHGAWPPKHEPDPFLVERLRGDKEFLVVHAGNLGGAGAWETLVEAAEKLPSEVGMLFVGGGFRETGMHPIPVIPFRPEDEVPSVMKAGDLQVVTLRSGMEGLVVPSKFYSIIANGRPVLAVVPSGSDIARVVEHVECGIVADPADPADVLMKILWAKENPGELERMAANALTASRGFDRGQALASLADLVLAVGKRSSGEQ
ncbi:MAG TPA: glycosyltransferase family 4 protein [Actinomycetota bacterium]|nr:glycosyltransferase family 4 protein [Actinomycetota bacterium]